MEKTTAVAQWYRK